MELTREDVATRITQVMDELGSEECRSCDCLHGYITQLDLDASEDVSDIVDALKVPRDQMHGCLGCSPCPPGAKYAQYKKELQSGQA